MAKSLDKILQAISDIEEAETLIQTENITADTQKKLDMDKVLSILDDATRTLIESVVIYQKYEKAQ